MQSTRNAFFTCSKLDAVNGLLKIIPKHGDVVQKKAAEIYLNQHQATDLRIVASVVLFKSNPSLSLLQSLAGDLLSEPNDQVRAFVVSMIKEIDSNDYPCFRGL